LGISAGIERHNASALPSAERSVLSLSILVVSFTVASESTGQGIPVPAHETLSLERASNKAMDKERLVGDVHDE
jgi:hypothetical protein